MNNSYFSPIYGLVTSHDNFSENGGLHFSQYLRLKSDLNIAYSAEDRITYEAKMFRSQVGYGLYRRDETRTERTVSHDEITGMVVASKLLNTSHASEIWKYLLSHFFIYDPNNNRPYPAFAPQWICLWAELMDSKLFKWLLPYTLISILLTTKSGSQQDTSGKLLYFTLLKRDSFLWKIYKSRMEKLYGPQWVKSVFSIYFHTEPKDHPLIELSEAYHVE